MRKSSVLCLSLLTTGLLTSGAALATPVIYIDGIGVPIGPVQINQVDHETLIVPTVVSSGSLPAQPNLEGVGIVSTITDGNGFPVTYGLPTTPPPPFLYDEFSGFTINNNPAVTYVDSSGAGNFI